MWKVGVRAQVVNEQSGASARVSQEQAAALLRLVFLAHERIKISFGEVLEGVLAVGENHAIIHSPVI